jgi:hypothetical protein
MQRICLVWLIAACGGAAGTPTPTGTTCADPDPLTGTTTLTWDNFGSAFMAKYCTSCHSSLLTNSHRNGAPYLHDFDTLLGVMRIDEPTSDHIDEQAGWGPAAHNNFMPGERCPSVPGGRLDEDCIQPSGEERTNLAVWLACEQDRPHDFVDAGVGSAN